ncbi:MAG: VWA-like domain-containing protein [Elusimicrobiota bacterium]
MQPEEIISNVIIRLITLNPFFGVLLSSLEKIKDETIIYNGKPTFATDGFKIFYHPQVLTLFTLSELEGILLHEVLHGIFEHCLKSRIGNRNPDLWNIACDIVVNIEIKEMGYDLPAASAFDYRFRDMLPEEIYEILNKKSAVFVKRFDIHMPLLDEDEEKLTNHILTAYEISKDSIGDLPLGLIRAINKLKPSKINWQKILHYIAGEALAKDELNYHLPNKKYIPYDIYLPSLRSYTKGSLIVAIDTSGSITNEQLIQFVSEIKKISYLVDKFFLITCDASVHEIVEIEQFENFLHRVYFKGGGGTDFNPVFKIIREKRLNPDLLIYLTDGEGDYPEFRPPYPVLWILTKNYNVPWGNKLVIS